MQAVLDGFHFEAPSQGEADELAPALVVGGGLQTSRFGLQELAEGGPVFFLFYFFQGLEGAVFGHAFEAQGLRDFRPSPLVVAEFVAHEAVAVSPFVDEPFADESPYDFFAGIGVQSPSFQFLADVGGAAFRP